ncbi:MAG: L-threonylcarbamoyladenylate synthase [candidate division Zixibacteria bacterium]
MSREIKCDPVHPEDKTVQTIIAALNGKRIVVLPTETQYALSVRADASALEKIGRIKKRNLDLKPALFVKDMDMAEKFCMINKIARQLAEKFLPGPLTLVMPERKGQSFIPSEYKSELGFGLRLSSSPVIAAVMSGMDRPVTATSANISGQCGSSDINSIRQELGDAVDLYVNAGPCRAITPSTVLWVGDDTKILRPGMIPEREIEKALAEIN